MKKGLTLGKYAPFHKGHQLVIETGLAEVDEMVVIIYESPHVTRIPLPVRSGWIRSLYPQVRVIEAWGGPSEVGYTPELMKAHEQYVLKSIKVGDITHFYSSEPYGDHMAKALGAVDRRVDETRTQVPVSGTHLRNDPYRFRDFIHPLVYRDLIINVVFLGAPCTGKTTLSRHLAEKYDTQWMPEYGREYWEEHQLDRRLSPEQLEHIAACHLEREDEFLEKSNKYLFTDTNALTTSTFARYYHGKVTPVLSAFADRSLQRYDLVFLCDTDIPYDDSWDRSGETKRNEFQLQVIADLHQRRISYFRLRGELKDRIARVDAILGRFEKYMNVLDLFGGA